jgi:hypothetical protein
MVQRLVDQMLEYQLVTLMEKRKVCMWWLQGIALVEHLGIVLGFRSLGDELVHSLGLKNEALALGK